MNNSIQPLDGVNTLVIGGGGDGIGRAISRAFAAAGADVAVADVDPDRARDAVQELTESGARAVPLVGDVLSSSDVDGFIAQTTAEFGRLDALVTVVGGQVASLSALLAWPHAPVRVREPGPTDCHAGVQRCPRCFPDGAKNQFIPVRPSAVSDSRLSLAQCPTARAAIRGIGLPVTSGPRVGEAQRRASEWFE
jgi:short chain dehydrogenase